MSFLSRWHYKMLFSFAIMYVTVSCIVAYALLWNTPLPSPIDNTVTLVPNKSNDNLVPSCATSKELIRDPLLNCTLLDSLSYQQFLAQGWTKIVHKARLDNGVNIAIKTVNLNGKDVIDCSRSLPLLDCHNKATEKLLREIQLLETFQHENIIKLLYYCSKTEGGDGCMKYAVIGTELGDTLSNLKLLQMSWRERKQIIQDLAQLIHYSNSQNLGLADLRRPQFVIVNGRLKLADLDDILIGEPLCTSALNCSGNFVFLKTNKIFIQILIILCIFAGLNITIDCISGRCSGYNMKLNVQKSFREFGPYIFIPEGVPKEATTNLKKLKKLWGENMVPTSHLLSVAMTL